ncbi:lytic transglycosylase domain-containing protein [Neisseria sp. Ec49-e6-T10]|uniref:lytic transglycosylase domain-containing protein n=1 Tax=Neisseria sp. Ec49-e6-T10 TaxID=3140744 RepID=UPI003EB73417
MLDCPNLAVPAEIMQHVVYVESSHNPFAIGVVGGRLVRQPRNLQEAIATAEMLRQKGYNYSVGLAQVNQSNFKRYQINSHSQAFDRCRNLQAGAKILRECYERSGKDWGKAFSCYYSGNFVTGFKHGYVQKILASLKRAQQQTQSVPVQLNNRAVATPNKATANNKVVNTRQINTPTVQPTQAVSGVRLPPTNGKSNSTDWFGIPTPATVLSQNNGLENKAPAPKGGMATSTEPSVKKQQPSQGDSAFVF